MDELEKQRIIAEKYTELHMIQEAIARLTGHLSEASHELTHIYDRLAKFEDDSQT